MLTKLLAVFVNWFEDRYGARSGERNRGHVSRRIEPTVSYRSERPAGFGRIDPPVPFRRSGRG